MADAPSKRDNRVTGPWSAAEDEVLHATVQRLGPYNWTLISESIRGRSGKSCRLRWCNQLSPQVAHDPFSTEEDLSIIHAQRRFGNKWATIAHLLPTATSGQGRALGGRGSGGESEGEEVISISGGGAAADLPVLLLLLRRPRRDSGEVADGAAGAHRSRGRARCSTLPPPPPAERGEEEVMDLAEIVSLG